PGGLLGGGAGVGDGVLALVEPDVLRPLRRSQVEGEADRQGLVAVPVRQVAAVRGGRRPVPARRRARAHRVGGGGQDAFTARGGDLEDRVVRVPGAQAAEGEGAARLRPRNGGSGTEVGDGGNAVAVVAQSQGAARRWGQDVEVVPVGVRLADG